MEILILSFLTACGYLIVLAKIFSLRGVIKHQVLIDLIATAGIPWLFYGSFSGMATAVLAGLFVSIFLWFLGVLQRGKSLLNAG